MFNCSKVSVCIHIYELIFWVCILMVIHDSRAQVVGWPPVRSYRKNVLQQQQKSSDSDMLGMYVKVSMDGAPYLRKIDIKVYKNYPDLLMAVENLFKCSMGKNPKFFELFLYADV